MQIQDLIDLGMTEVEAKIYFELCKVKSSIIGPIIKKTGLHRGTVYNALNQLLNKGFISYIEEGGIRKYFLKPDSLISMLNIKRQNIENQEKKIEEFISTLNSNPSKENEITLHVGQQAFKILLNDSINKTKESNKEYLFIGGLNECIEVIGEEYMKKIQNAKKINKIKSRMLINQSIMKQDIAYKLEANIKYLPEEYIFPASTWIFEDKVVITLFNTTPITTLLIENADVAKNYRAYFERLWNIPIKFNDRESYRERLANMIKTCKTFDVLCRNEVVPFFLYPHVEKKFIAYRSATEKRRNTLTGKKDIIIYRDYKKLWGRNAKIRYVACETSLTKYFKMIEDEFGKKELKRMLKEIIKNLNNFNVEINIINEFNPYNLYITEKDFMIVLPAVNDIYGFATLEPEIKETFKRLFEEFVTRSENITDWMKRKYGNQI